MKAPPAFLGAALALWGVANGMALAGIALGVLVEAARFAPRSTAIAGRAELVARIVLLLALAKLGYAAATQPFPQALYSGLRWLPVILAPLPMLQMAGARIPRIPDVTYPYAIVTLVGAATGSTLGPWFYPAAAALVAYALVTQMPPARRIAGAALLAAGIGIGFATHTGLFALQGRVEDWSTELLSDYFAPKPDAFRERTRIGDMGRIKLSDRIAMRVVPAGPKRPDSLLLREAVFDTYYNGEWRTAQRAFKPAPREGQRWHLRQGPSEAAQGRTLTLRRSLFGSEGLIALPAGSLLLDRLAADSVETLALGTVRARGLSSFLAFGVAYDDALESDAPLAAADLGVPETLSSVLAQLVAGENLKRATDRETLAAVERYFADHFSYTLSLSDPNEPGRTRTLVEFLQRDRKGHCEYFATSTVLLLRSAGIPARYTVGYSAQEYSDFERAFLVRNRHAHAWTSAYIDGRWVNVDTTPARWAQSEGEQARSAFGPAMDLLSWLFEKAVGAWLDRTPAQLARDLGIATGLLFGIALGALAIRRWRARARRPRSAPPSPATTAWQALERRLAEQGFRREHGETALAWARRLRRENQFERWRGELVDLARAYYRARFDPDTPIVDVEQFVYDARRWRNDA